MLALPQGQKLAMVEPAIVERGSRVINESIWAQYALRVAMAAFFRETLPA